MPTMSGWIGSSRPPRSISTASAMRVGRPKSASSSSAARIGAAGVEHVVDDHDVLAVDVDGNSRLPDDRPRADGLEVVAVERDVERALRHLGFLALGDGRYDLRRELDAAALNADDDEIVGAVVQLDDLVGHAPERSIERARVEDCGLFWGRSHGARNIADPGVERY